LAREALTGITDFAAVDEVVLVGGTATSAASVLRGARTKIDRYDVTRADLQRILVRLCGMRSRSARRSRVSKRNAPISCRRLIVLDTALDLLGHDRALVTSADLLIGFLISQRDAAGTPPKAPGGRSSVPQPASR